MMRHEVEIDGPDRIVRAHQIAFVVPQQIAEIDRLELAERHDAADRLAVLRIVRVLARLELVAVRIRLAAAGERRRDRLPRRRHDPPVEARDRYLVPRLEDGMRRLAVQLRVRLLEPRDLLALFDARPVIEEMRDRDPLRQFLHAADVIDVVVREQQVIDLLEPDLRHDRHDPIRVAAAGIPGIDQQRLAGRRNEQRGFSTLGVDDVDVERFGSSLRRWQRSREYECEDDPQGPTHQSSAPVCIQAGPRLNRQRRDSTLVFTSVRL